MLAPNGKPERGSKGCGLGGVELNPPSRIAIQRYFQKYPIFSIIVDLFTTKNQ